MIEGPFRGSEALAAGLLSRSRLFGPRYRRLLPDVYCPAELHVDADVRCVAGYLFLQRQGGVLGGWSAAQLLGAGCSPGRAAVEVLIDRVVKPRAGLRITRATVAADEVARAGGCRVTAPLRTAFDLARREPLVEAVAAVDALARCGRFHVADLAALRRDRAGWRGVERLDRVLPLVDPRAESVMETRTRLMLVLGGLPSPHLQHRIVDGSGYVLARVDLAYPEARVAIEYDGAQHFNADRARRDRTRDLQLADLGWYTVRLSFDDVWLMPPQTVARIRRLLAERRRPSTVT